MAEFTANPQRFDPYKGFNFRLKWDGRYVAGVSKVSALKRTTEVVEHREGGDPSTSRKSPGRTKYEAITLERGVTHDLEFEAWAAKVWQIGAGHIAGLTAVPGVGLAGARMCAQHHDLLAVAQHLDPVPLLRRRSEDRR